MMPTQYGNPAGAGSRVRRMDKEDTYLIHIHKESNYLQHYGVKGQKWGVTTKEYEPVAVDHRRTRFLNPVKKMITRSQERDRQQELKDQEMREQRQAWMERRDQRMKVAGTILGVSALALSLYGGYKLSKIKPNGSNVLKGLLNIKPDGMEWTETKRNAGNLFMAKMQPQTNGLARVKQTFQTAGGLLTMRKYRNRIRQAKEYIHRFGSMRAG